MSQFLDGPGTTNSTRMRHAPLAPKKRRGVGAQPADGTRSQRPTQFPILTTRKRA